METLKDWVVSELRHEYIAAIAEHGAQRVYPGPNDCRDMAEQYAEFTEDVWRLVRERASTEGESVLSLLWTYPMTGPDDFANAMGWVAVEWICCGLVHDQEGG